MSSCKPRVPAIKAWAGHLALLGYAVLLALEITELASRWQAGSVYEPPPWDGTVLFVGRLGCLFAAAAAVRWLGDSCPCGDDPRRYRCPTVLSLLDQVRIPLLAVEHDGSVALWNQEALRLLGDCSVACQGRRFGDIFDGECPDLNDDGLDQKVWTLVRQDGTVFPAGLKVSPLTFPRREKCGLSRTEEVELYMIALRDMTPIFRLQEQVEQSTRLHTAMEVATEIGHWVRNPLTSIRIAGDFAATVLTQSLRQGPAVSNRDVSHLVSMCQIISVETDRLERKLQEFLNCADKDHDTLLELMADAEAWAKRLKPVSGERVNG